MIIEITFDDVKTYGKLPSRIVKDDVEVHIRSAERRLASLIKTGSYETDLEAYRELKIIFTLINLVPVANLYYGEGINKMKETGSEFRLLSKADIKDLIEIYETNASRILKDIKKPDEGSSEDQEAFTDIDLGLSTMAGDRSTLDLSGVD